MKPLRIVLPGGSGQLGHILARWFSDQGQQVTVIARRPVPGAWRSVEWNGRDPGKWVEALDGADVVINLAGRSVNCRYTEAHRREIMDSRVRTTELVGRAVAQVRNPPAVWMNASTATIYRHAPDRPMDEATGELGGSEPGVTASWRFSIDVATSWERTFFAADTPHTRRIALRAAPVMSPDRGGHLDMVLKLIRARLGGAMGPGSQFVSWIHETDFARAVAFLIEHREFSGLVNVSAPNPLPNRDFLRELRHAYGVRFGLPAATWMLEIGAILLRTETELILKSRRVVPGRLLQAGFAFQYPMWRTAAQDLVRRWLQGGIGLIR